MFTERTSIGLDVHARSVAAAAIDGVTGELFQTKLTPSYDHIQSWVDDLPGPVAVAYEAGTTGFGLYRHLADAGIRCEPGTDSQSSCCATGLSTTAGTPGPESTTPGCVPRRSRS